MNADLLDAEEYQPTTTTTAAERKSKPCTPTKELPKKTKSFRLEGKNLFLTFPQTTTTRQEALDALLSLPLKVKGAIVSQEKHVDQELHLHLVILLEEKLRTRNANYFDSLCGKHGNYQTIRSLKATIPYVLKEDKEALIYGEVPRFTKDKSELKSNRVAKMLQSGSTLEEVAEIEPGYFMLNKRKIQEYQSWCFQKSQKKQLKKLVLPLQYSGQNLDTVAIVDWLNMNLSTSRPFKALQLFLSGPPNCLKTSLINSLKRYLMVYHMPLHEDFYDSYSEDLHELVVLDEFKGQKTIQFLNEWLQGSVMTYKIKGSQGTKYKNLPMIIISNFQLDQCYKDINKVSTLQARLLEIYIHGPIDLDNIKFE